MKRTSTIKFEWDCETGEVDTIYWPKNLGDVSDLMRADVWMDIAESCDFLHRDALACMEIDMSEAAINAHSEGKQ